MGTARETSGGPHESASPSRRPLHIALVYTALNRRGGVERVVWEAARHFSARHRVTVICGEADPSTLGAEIVRVPGAPFPGTLGPLRFRRAAAHVLESVEPDVSVSFGSDCPDSPVLVMQSVHRTWVAGGSSVRVGPVTVPAWIRQLLPRHRIRLALERATLRTLLARPGARVVAVSPNVSEDLVHWYGVPPAIIDVVPNGFDPEQCSPERSRELRPQVRAELGIDDDEVVLLFVANEYHRKGLGVLLQAMTRAGVASPRVRLVLVGRMEPSAYGRVIDELGLAGRVHWIGPVEDVGRCYAGADLFVLPTRYEAFGSVIIEALASGTPVVTSSLAGAAVAVHPGENGLLLQDPSSVDELAGALAQALEPGALAAWAPNCRPAVDGFEWSSAMDRLEEVVVNVAARGARG
ncbi:MAG TPA: glycosyltransferase family 4 protein [Acidimicrobiales bacterium]|nr:glycosyltransferase family 4 protein [Acidimicrobiales bacterium]